MRKKTFKRLVSIIIALGIFSLGIVVLWISTFDIPTLDSFNDRKVVESTKIYDRTGEILLYDVYQDIKRTVIPFEEISVNIKNATIAIEDTEFYNHSGIRPLAFLRAVITNLITLDPYGQGGSTITQQVVKNSLLTQDKKISRKLKEWVLAVRLEQIMKKDEILNIYLNESPYGGSVYGVEEASLRFFGKSARDLDIAEASYLAALPQAPTYYSPYGNHLDALENRKNLVLNRMLSEGFITNEEYDTAKEKVVEFQPQSEYGIKAPHFVVYVKEILAEKYGDDVVESGGLTVITTLDYSLQEKGEEIVKKHSLENAEKFDAENAALIAIDPKNGDILTMVGSRDYFDEEIDGNFNITIAERQPGSAFKPFIYAEAFNKGYTPDTILFDLKTQFSTSCAPSDFTSEDGCYSPGNYDNVFRGPMTIRDALAQSVNVPAVKAFYLAGRNDSLRFAKNLGVSTLTNIDQYGLTLVLGGGEVKLLDMTSAYGTFANAGVRQEPNAILEVKDSKGNILEKKEISDGKIIMDPNTSYLISDVLSDNEARTPAFGSNSYLHFPGRDVAAKTGTTNDYRDAWILGYTPNIAVGAWAGNNDNTPMDKKVAGFIIAPLWNEFMNEVLSDRSEETFPDPITVENPLFDLKPVLRGIWQGGVSELTDTRNNSIANENTPPSYVKETVSGGVHSILYWVEKDDPRGPYPTRRDDSQFDLWEYSVSKWSRSQGFSSTEVYENIDSIRAALVVPNNITVGEETTFILESQSNSNISKVDYYINNNLVSSKTSELYMLKYIPKKTGSHNIEAVIRTQNGVEKTVQEIFTVSQ
ncbi:MAG: penicillin-binding protein [Candidatus Pacebacteria bacterium]|nr:penicillin-binding protein [Candidatus Paceibacterota bacterium]